MTMKFLPDVKVYEEMQNLQKKFEISHLVCKLWVCKVQKRSNSSFLEMYLLGVVTSQNFAQLSILTSETDPKTSDRYLNPIFVGLFHVR